MKYLVAGLGNIGPEYYHTRHNIGFKIADALAEQAGASFVPDRLADKAEIKFKGRTIHIIKPTTYMNLSGKSIRYWLQELKLQPSNLMVVVDDIALPFGKVRLRSKGGDAGHNGLKSINELLGGNQYPRLRFGIGNEFFAGQQVDYVLGKWNEEEQAALPDGIKTATEAVKAFTTLGIQRAMNMYN